MQLARKIRPLTIVQPPEKAVQSAAEPSGINLKDAFEGWLNSVNPAVLQSQELTATEAPELPGRRPITSRDIVRVNRATVRESNAHRHWPPDVVQSFLAANIIKRNSI